MEAVVVRIPRVIAERLRREAEKAGMSLDEYLIELVSRSLDPGEKLQVYLDAAQLLLEQAREELEKGSLRQAAEKLWGAVALAIKAYALWREGRRLASHRELWEYKDVAADELGGWVSRVFREASSLHTCFYEGWCTERDVRDVLPGVERLLEAIRARVEG